MTIATDFKDYIEGILEANNIGRGIHEYQRAKDVLRNDLSHDEYWKAIKVVAAWCGV